MNESKTYCNPTWDGTKLQLETGRINIHSIELDNLPATDYWLQIFDAATADVNLGTTAPAQSYLIPAGNGTLYAQMEKIFAFAPMSFTKGCTFAVTTTPNGAAQPGGKTFPLSITYRRPLQGQT